MAEKNFGKLVDKPKTIALLLNYAKNIREEKSFTDKEVARTKDNILNSLNQRDIDDKKKIKSESIGPILLAIQKSIQQEKNNESFYPEYMTEQVLTAFFCEKFNIQADIWSLLEHLDDDIIDKSISLPTEEDLLNKSDPPLIAQKQQAYTLDDIYALVNASIFDPLIPYKSDSHLVSNGNTYRYDRKAGKILEESHTFADCAEIAMRHLINLLTYNSEIGEFDLTPLKKYVTENSPDNPYFQNLIVFMEQQKPDQANNGDTVMRSLFNIVVADLNASNSSIKIDYIQDTNEVNPGFINLIKVFQKIFGLKIKELPQGSFQEKINWLEESLQTLFKALNPYYSYSFDVSKLEETENEISGHLPIIVRDLNNYEDLFSFSYYSQYKTHSAIKDLKILKTTAKNDYNEDLQTHATTIRPNTSEESIWLLTPQKMNSKKFTHPIFTLFNRYIADNDSRIEIIKMINEYYDQWKTEGSSFKSHLPVIKTMIDHLFEDISWDDATVLSQISPWILSLSKQEDLKENLRQVRGIILESSERSTIEELNNFLNIEKLSIISAKKLEEISLTNLTNLKTFSLDAPRVKKIEGLNTLKNLEKLDLFSVHFPEEISIANLGQLKEINLDSSLIKRVNLNNLEKLNEISLKGLVRLEEASFSNLESVKKINLVRSGLKTLTLENLDAVESIDFTSLPNLERIIFKGSFKNLKSLSFEGTPKIKHIEGLESFKDETITLKGNVNRTTIKGSGLSTRVIDDEWGSTR